MKLAIFLTCLLCYTAVTAVRKTNHEQTQFLIPDERGVVHFVDISIAPFFVDPIDSTNITLQLFTQANPDTPLEFHPHEVDAVIDSGLFDPSRPTLFNTHGWTGSVESRHINGVRDTILSMHDFNIINIDWSGPAGTFYTQAVEYVNPVGDMVGDFINRLTEHYESDTSNIGLMGHSLGAQVIGRIGLATNGGIEYIIALDPAWPLFSVDDMADRLDTGDANFVQIIHTNSGFLGFPFSIGHADFYPNGGVKQPGCGTDLTGACSHGLVQEMIVETYTTEFLGWRCDSYEDFAAGECSDNESAFMGGWPVDVEASGDYYMTTNASPPFVIE